MEKCIFILKNRSLLYSSFFLIIFILLLRMNGVCYHSGVVLVALPIFWTTVDQFFFGYVNRFMIGTVDRSCSVSFDRCRVFCFVPSPKVACCDELWIINSFFLSKKNGSLILPEDVCGFDCNRIVEHKWLYECQAQLVGLHVAHFSYF